MVPVGTTVGGFCGVLSLAVEFGFRSIALLTSDTKTSAAITTTAMAIINTLYAGSFCQ
jgi:hypothetical protein